MRNQKFLITSGTPTREEIIAIGKALRIPVEKKATERASLWRKSQIRQPLPRKWGQLF
ncbi:MAG: hypothetical protein F2856_04270 [Actinobacteria bacterium]|nr:hypothetical protein [Actinomycetota bacterium]